MECQTAAWSQNQEEALVHAWGEYRVWAATARQKKAELTNWRLRVLFLTIAGALLGTVSSQIAGLQPTLAWIVGLTAGACIALATYLSRELLKPDQERQWVRARSIAESLKAETFLFRTGAPPYNGADPAACLIKRMRELLETVEELPAAILTPEQRRERLPVGPLCVEQYIEERVNEQVQRFYEPKAQQYTKLMKRWGKVTLFIGGAAAVLGILGEWAGAWVAVLTTISTAVVAHVFSNRYQYLVVSYQATARQLENLKRQWTALGAAAKGPAQRHRFILDCEEAISIENSAWMARYLGNAPEVKPG